MEFCEAGVLDILTQELAFVNCAITESSNNWTTFACYKYGSFVILINAKCEHYMFSDTSNSTYM